MSGTAIPRITTDFGSLSAIAWYGASYLLVVTAFQPFFGNLYKFFNAKFVYIISLLIFEVGSIVCATAKSSDILIFGRALLGFGASGLLQGALAIIGSVVSLQKVPLYQGIVIAGVGVSVCVGPIIGGALTEYASWRWCFWINVPAGFCALIVVSLFVPLAQISAKDSALSLRQKFTYMDPVGTFLFLGLVCSLLLALTWGGQQYAWSDSRIIGLLVGSGLILMAFAFWDWRQGDKALIPLRVIRKRSVCMGALILFAYGVAMYVYGYYLPLFFQSVQDASAIDSGVRYLAMMMPQIVTLALTGAIVSIWGYYVPYIIAGGVIASVGAGLLTTIGVDTSTAQWAAYLAITGVGIGMASQLPYTALHVVLDSSDIATGNAIAVFSSQLGGALGIAIGQNLLLTQLGESLPRYTNAVTLDQVLAAGASGLKTIATSPEVLEALRRVYTRAIRDVLILGLACTCLSLVPSLAMEWLNITHESRRRKQLHDSLTRDEAHHREYKDGARPTEVADAIDSPEGKAG
ncbi:hypothetical protein HIM_02298 [Hirsutella minnesotensis 3608]|nr:hypothetical protein HIM_02298 [Hirsutella minnesotensis 3608]